jgi:hypothetical protein
MGADSLGGKAEKQTEIITANPKSRITPFVSLLDFAFL